MLLAIQVALLLLGCCLSVQSDGSPEADAGSRGSSPRFHPRTFRPRAARQGPPEFDSYDHGAVADALRGQHLVMIGDSLMRYQYIDLIYFIEFKKFPEMFPNILRESDYFSVTSEWIAGLGASPADRGWTAFMLDLSRLFKGSERCDCYRSVTENRFYHNEELGVRVSFFLKQGTPIPGHNFSADGAGPSHSVNREAYLKLNRPPDWVRPA